jgi:hypothetical protein
MSREAPSELRRLDPALLNRKKPAPVESTTAKMRLDDATLPSATKVVPRAPDPPPAASPAAKPPVPIAAVLLLVVLVAAAIGISLGARSSDENAPMPPSASGSRATP